jgi:predicted Fe-Mo cluster-binding NifX family protein
MAVKVNTRKKRKGKSKMKICVTTQGTTLDDQVEMRFGRAKNLIFVDTETGAYECVENPGSSASGGAGISAGQMVADKGAISLLTGNVGPNAFDVLKAAGVTVYTNVSGTIREALAAFKSGACKVTDSATVDSHFGAKRT